MSEHHDNIPGPIAAAFANRATLPAKDLCALLRMDPKTLRDHCRAGNIRFILKGMGESRPRREFTLSDVMGFFKRRARDECLSTGRRARRSSTSTSSTPVIDFTARQSRRSGDLPRR